MRILLLCFMLLIVLPLNLVMAQSDGPDYAITNLQMPYMADDDTVIIVFDVINNGSAASVNATVRLVSKDSGSELATEIIRPLLAGENIKVTLNIPSDTLTTDAPQSTLVSVGIDEVEPSTGNIANNMANIDLPAMAELQAQPTPSPTTTPDEGTLDLTLPETLTVLGFTFDMNNPIHIGILIGIAVALVIMLVLMLVILRLLFRSQPSFKVLPPPYTNVPPQPAHTNAGRRQGWQLHAQNDLPPASPANEGATHIRKLLLSMDGTPLNNWKITGIRLSQYDQYGRVSRSEFIAPSGMVNKLSKLASQYSKYDDEKLQKRAKSIAKALTHQFVRKIDKRNTMLPIAIDLSFQGTHGAVRILFELFHLEQGRWKKVDTWEPEMTVTGKNIHETFTYSLRGQLTSESVQDFNKRLQDDVAKTLFNMLGKNKLVSAAQTDTWRDFRPPVPAPDIVDDPLAKG